MIASIQVEEAALSLGRLHLTAECNSTPKNVAMPSNGAVKGLKAVKPEHGPGVTRRRKLMFTMFTEVVNHERSRLISSPPLVGRVIQADCLGCATSPPAKNVSGEVAVTFFLFLSSTTWAATRGGGGGGSEECRLLE